MEGTNVSSSCSSANHRNMKQIFEQIFKQVYNNRCEVMGTTRVGNNFRSRFRLRKL